MIDMGPDQWANWSSSVLMAAAAGYAAVTYQLKARWRLTRIGRHIMAVTVAVGLLGLYTVLVSIWPAGPAAAALRYGRTALQVVLAVAMVQRSRLITDAQRRPDHPPDDDH
jgi:hypothetical protein